MKTENKIELLKKELDFLIANNAPYEDVFRLSSKIDKLLVKLYSENVGSNQSCEKSRIPNTTTNA
jgi:hypothetical protein